ncbi:MAG: S8 family peptidase, partial [Patescibacteria group bacterium]
GHGTHIAGIIAAVDNTFGVVGVGPQISLYGVKVLNRNGSGYLSDVIEGLDWAIANGMQVINMSLGTSSDIQSFRDAVQRVNAAGIVQVAAAGNSGGAVNFPGAYPEVIAVSATDNTNTIASWSSRGSEVDLAAPGVNIYSTYRGSKYATLSGTSMASPHVAGAAALVLTQTAKCDSDFNGVCSPVEVQQRLENTAEDLGISGKDSLYGAGLIDAQKAVVQ